MKYVSSIVLFQLFTKTTCEKRLYYAEFGSSRLQKRLEYGGNVKNGLFLIIFKSEKNKDFDLTIDKVFANLLTTPYKRDFEFLANVAKMHHTFYFLVGRTLYSEHSVNPLDLFFRL